MKNIKFDWNDISLIPEAITSINSRSQIKVLNNNGKLPLFVSPMDTVINEHNYKEFLIEGYNICLPRGENVESESVFISYGLDEIIQKVENNKPLPPKVLIDIANGHLKKLYDISEKIKNRYPETELMVGNIANPETYRILSNIKVDYIRVGIGAGSGCLTSANGSIHYPMASLINECYDESFRTNTPAKIIADGGFKNYSDIIKALALGADYVMLGGVLNKALESCSDSYEIDQLGNYNKISKEEAKELFNKNYSIYKYFRGMSTKEVQKKWKKHKITTSEGIVKYNKVEYTLTGWTNNFKDYLKSAMSYCGKKDLKSFIGKAEYIFITQNAFNRFNK